MESTNPHFKEFYQGFPHHCGVVVQPERLIIYVPQPKYVEDAYNEANKRINLMCLPLTAKRTGELSNTFIIVPNEQNSFDRISEQIGACHA